MNDRLSNLESRVDRLAQEVSDLERRVSSLDRGEAAAPAPPTGRPAPESDFGEIFSLAGRTLLALGGAYLLRAVTEAGALPRIAGVSLAGVYAGAWIYFGDRAGTASKPASAAFHIGSAALVGYPLLWEATVRLQALGPAASAALLVGLTVAILTVARRHELEPGAWVAVIAANVTSAALLFGTRAVVPFVAAVVATALATLWLWRSRGGPLAWVSAVAADLAVVVLTFGALVQSASVSVPPALTIQLALFLGYAGVFIRRSVVEKKETTVFEMTQGGAATLAGYGGAAAIAATTPALAAVVSIGILGALACYGAMFRAPSVTSQRSTRTFVSALALAIALTASGASLPQPAWLWAILAVAGYALGRRVPLGLDLHGSVYLLAAAASSGLLRFSLWAIAAPPTTWPSLSSSSLVTLAAGISSAVLSARGAADGDRWARLPRALALSVALIGGAAVAIFLLAPAVSGDPARLAALRTALLAVASVGLAAISRGAKMKEAGWLSAALLVLSAAKLLAEDFRHGRPETLFLGLAFYGAALILVSRLSRRSTATAEPPLRQNTRD